MKIKKIRKNFQRTIYITGLKFSEKNFLQKSRNDSVAASAQIGGVYLQRTRRHNIGTLRTYRAYIYRAGRVCRAGGRAYFRRCMDLKAARYFRGLFHRKIYSYKYTAKNGLRDQKINAAFMINAAALYQ